MAESEKVKTTKEIIQTCFLKLLDKKTIDKITVRELCTEANVHRGTFYRYYEDMYDLSAQIQADLLKELENIYDTSLDASIHDIAKRVIHLIYQEKLAFGSLFRYKRTTNFYHQVVDLGRKYLYNQPPFSQFSDREKLYIYNCICAGVLGVIQTWIDDDFNETPEKIIHYIEQCMNTLIIS